MAVKIGHASIDENGGIQGKTKGDQTGKEVCTRLFYIPSYGWDYYLEPLDDALAEKAASYVEQICADDNFGYSQVNRWAGFQSIVNNGRKVKGAKGDWDCSSLMIGAYILAGLNIAASGYTGNERKILEGTGKFKAHSAKEYLTSDKKAKRGGIWLSEGHHTIMALQNGSEAQGSSQPAKNDEGNTSYCGKGIGTATAKMNMNVRSGFGTKYGSVGGVLTGQSVEVLEILSNGWYKIVWPGAACGYAYTSNASNKYYTYVANKKEGIVNSSLKAVAAKSGPSATIKGKYITTGNLNLRAVPGELKDENIMAVMPKGATVQNYGYYTMVNGVKWLYVVYGDLVGYCSIEYLKKS